MTNNQSRAQVIYLIGIFVSLTIISGSLLYITETTVERNIPEATEEDPITAIKTADDYEKMTQSVLAQNVSYDYIDVKDNLVKNEELLTKKMNLSGGYIEVDSINTNSGQSATVNLNSDRDIQTTSSKMLGGIQFTVGNQTDLAQTRSPAGSSAFRLNISQNPSYTNYINVYIYHNPSTASSIDITTINQDGDRKDFTTHNQNINTIDVGDGSINGLKFANSDYTQPEHIKINNVNNLGDSKKGTFITSSGFQSGIGTPITYSVDYDITVETPNGLYENNNVNVKAFPVGE